MKRKRKIKEQSIMNFCFKLRVRNKWSNKVRRKSKRKKPAIELGRLEGE